MAVSRSPNYPQMDLAEALEAIRPAYKAENRNRMSREVISRHFGYSSLNGRALAKIGAVRAYGLIEGTQDDLRISEGAITCLEAPEGSPFRADSLAKCAANPAIFQEIMANFPTLPSEHNLRFFLVKRQFTPEAASKAAKNYLSTMRLVEAAGGSYDSAASQEEEEPMQPQPATASGSAQRIATALGLGDLPPRQPQALVPAGMRQSVFSLDEGDVTLTFPANLSSEGYAELKEYLDIFLRRAQRSKRIEEAQEDFRDPPTQ